MPSSSSTDHQSSHFVFLLLVAGQLLLGAHVAAAADNYCQAHRFPVAANLTDMEFTKERVTKEYAILGEYKSMHCCARNYRSIEW